MTTKTKKTSRKPRTTRATSKAKDATPTPAATVAKPAGKKRKPETKKLSALDAAAQVLKTSGPLNCKELIEAMSAQGLWISAGGKTPHAQLRMTQQITRSTFSACIRSVVRKLWECIAARSPIL